MVMAAELYQEFQLAFYSRDKVDQVKAVLAKNPDVNEPIDEWGMLITFRAVQTGAEVLTLFLDHGVDVNAICRVSEQQTLLMAASYLGRLDSLQLLLERGADVHRKDRYGNTALSNLGRSQYSPWAKIVADLIKAGADVNAHGPNVSPLMGCDDKRIDVAKLLIAGGANVNFISPAGTALHEAVKQKATKLIALLLANGADPNSTTGKGSGHPGLTALEYARKLKLKKVVAFLEEELGSATSGPPAKALTWEQFAEALTRLRKAKLLEPLRGPADEAALAKLDKAAGGALPADYRVFLASHDGQDGGDTIVGNPDDPGEPFVFLSASEIVDQIDWFKKNAKEVGNDGDITADDGVKAKYWNAKWIPFAGNGAGDFLSIDMAPTKQGAAGQIILFDHEDTHRPKIDDSFGILLTRWLETISN